MSIDSWAIAISFFRFQKITQRNKLRNQHFDVTEAVNLGDGRDGGPVHAAAGIPRFNDQPHRITLFDWPDRGRQVLPIKPVNQFFTALLSAS